MTVSPTARRRSCSPGCSRTSASCGQPGCCSRRPRPVQTDTASAELPLVVTQGCACWKGSDVVGLGLLLLLVMVMVTVLLLLRLLLILFPCLRDRRVLAPSSPFFGQLPVELKTISACRTPRLQLEGLPMRRATVFVRTVIHDKCCVSHRSLAQACPTSSARRTRARSRPR